MIVGHVWIPCAHGYPFQSPAMSAVNVKALFTYCVMTLLRKVVVITRSQKFPLGSKLLKVVVITRTFESVFLNVLVVSDGRLNEDQIGVILIFVSLFTHVYGVLFLLIVPVHHNHMRALGFFLSLR